MYPDRKDSPEFNRDITSRCSERENVLPAYILRHAPLLLGFCFIFGPVQGFAFDVTVVGQPGSGVFATNRRSTRNERRWQRLPSPSGGNGITVGHLSAADWNAAQPQLRGGIRGSGVYRG